MEVEQPVPLDQLNETQLRKEPTKVEKLLAETDTTNHDRFNPPFAAL